MPRKPKPESNEPVSQDAFLRSINIVYDADEPERIGHFRPTAKAVPLLKSLIGEENERAYFVVAPYGSGKSLTAAYALQVVENRPGTADSLGQIADRLESVSPELQQMTDDAQGYLQQLLDRLVRPGSDGPRWFHKGKPMRRADSPRGLRTALNSGRLET